MHHGAAPTNTFTSHFADSDRALSLDPNDAFWSASAAVAFSTNEMGVDVAGHTTRVWSRWTSDSLYLLFECAFIDLHLKPNPVTTEETNKLWKWDVAELFIGDDRDKIRRYKEFEVSPQGEWVDLDIDLDDPRPEGGWLWQSGMEAIARIDHAARTWFGAMRIPLRSISKHSPEDGLEFRINLLRAQGPPERQVLLAWQPPMRPSFHTPEVFGTLRLVR